MLSKLAKSGWHSPTGTAWVLQAIQSSQVFLVAPLILHYFSVVEVAAWYLFASVNFIGAVIASRVMLTFSRLLATNVRWNSSGNSIDLSEVAERKKFQDIVGTMGSVQAGLSALNFLIAAVLGYLTLVPLVGEEHAGIWVAFLVYLIGSFASFLGSRYHSILIGMDRIAASNRWNALGALLAVCSSAASVYFLKSMLWAVLFSQLALVVGSIGARFTLSKLIDTQLVDIDSFRGVRWVAQKAIEPIWKSLVVQLSTMGVLPISAILVARTGDVGLAASLAFSTRILAAIDQAALAPFSSFQSRLAIYMAQKNSAGARPLLISRARLSLVLFISAAGVYGLAAPALLPLIGTKFIALPSLAWFSLVLLVWLYRFYAICLAPYYSLNVVLFWREFLGTLLCAGLVCYFADGGLLSFCWLLISLLLVCLGPRPILRLSESLQSTGWRVFSQIGLLPLVILAAFWLAGATLDSLWVSRLLK